MNLDLAVSTCSQCDSPSPWMSQYRDELRTQISRSNFEILAQLKNYIKNLNSSRSLHVNWLCKYPASSYNCILNTCEGQFQPKSDFSIEPSTYLKTFVALLTRNRYKGWLLTQLEACPGSLTMTNNTRMAGVVIRKDIQRHDELYEWFVQDVVRLFPA